MVEASGGLIRSERVRRAEAAIAVRRYSVEMTQVVERVVGVVGNREVEILVHLYRTGPSRPPELVALTGLSRPNVARLVARLESLGLVIREPGTADRRTVLTSLSPVGRRRLDALDEALGSFYARTAQETTAIIEMLGGAVVPPAAEVSGLDLVARLAAVGGPLMEQTELEVGPLGDSQRQVLLALSVWGEARAGRLADEVRLSSGGMTNLLNQLEARGYIERRHGAVAGDRRAVMVRLTRRGDEAAQRIADVVHANAGAVAAAMADTLAATGLSFAASGSGA